MTANDPHRPALALAAEGVRVLPGGRDKRLCTPRGYRDASADPDTVRELSRRHPGPHVAVATGAVSGRDVLDLYAGHSEARACWTANQARLPAMLA